VSSRSLRAIVISIDPRNQPQCKRQYGMLAAARRNLRGTNGTPPSLSSWMDSHFCTLNIPDYEFVATPDGKIVECGPQRRNIALIIWGAFLFLLVLVCYTSLLVGRGCFKATNVSGWWKGAREWLQQPLKLLAVLLDLGSDIWVLVQVSVETLH
jgi:hypothetical protein